MSSIMGLRARLPENLYALVAADGASLAVSYSFKNASSVYAGPVLEIARDCSGGSVGATICGAASSLLIAEAW